MIELNLKLENVVNFCQVISKIDGNFDIYNGKYVIDAKSLFGLFGLNFNRSIFLNSINIEEDLIIEILKDYIKINV